MAKKKQRESDNEFRIDEDRLDYEWVRQSDLMLNYGEHEADARFEHAQAKALFELTEAEVSLDVRLHPDEFGLPAKTTEPMIKAKVITDKRYRRAQRKLHEAKHDLDVAASAVSALEHKKKGLEKLVDLLWLNYHSEAKAPRDRNQRERFEEAGKRGARAADVTRRTE